MQENKGFPIETAPKNKWVLVYLPWMNKWLPAIQKNNPFRNLRDKKWRVRFNDHLTRYIEREPTFWRDGDIS